MTRTDKVQEIENLKESLGSSDYFYVADSSTMSVAQITNFRRMCFAEGVKVRVVKNTLAIKALGALENEVFNELHDVFKGPSTVLFTDTANVPAKLLKEYRKDTKGELPRLKAAYIDQSIYKGDDQLDALASLKSKEELIGDIVLLLQSPIKTVVGALQSGQNTLSGLLTSLEKREE